MPAGSSSGDIVDTVLPAYVHCILYCLMYWQYSAVFVWKENKQPLNHADIGLETLLVNTFDLVRLYVCNCIITDTTQ